MQTLIFFSKSNLHCQANSFYCSVIDLCTDRLKKTFGIFLDIEVLGDDTLL